MNRILGRLGVVMAVLAVVLVGFLSLVSLKKASAVGETGYIAGHIWRDDDGNWFYDKSTDTNGIHESIEVGSMCCISVRVFDGTTYQVRWTNASGNWDATVLAGVPVTVEIPPVDNGCTLFVASTPIVQTVIVSPNSTTTLPESGYGPIN